jgi:hypothetical protein
MLLLSQVSLMRQDIQDLIIFAFPEETQKALSLFEGISCLKYIETTISCLKYIETTEDYQDHSKEYSSYCFRRRRIIFSSFLLEREKK